MPGATTARLVVCASEMPMKAFMMPQTVPNRPTNGAVEPIVARTPVPLADAAARPAPRCATSRDRHPFLHAVGRERWSSAASAETLDLVGAAAPTSVQRRARARRPIWPTASSSARAELSMRSTPRSRACAGKFQRLGQPDGPGDQRGEGKPDHHALDHPVGGHEHSPRRQIVRQGRAVGAIRRRRNLVERNSASGTRRSILRRQSRRPRIRMMEIEEGRRLPARLRVPPVQERSRSRQAKHRRLPGSPAPRPDRRREKEPEETDARRQKRTPIAASEEKTRHGSPNSTPALVFRHSARASGTSRAIAVMRRPMRPNRRTSCVAASARSPRNDRRRASIADGD